MQKWLHFSICLACCLMTGTSSAETIKYTDKNGTLCFVDDLAKVPQRYRKNVVREKTEEAAQVVSSADEAAPAAAPATAGYDTGRVQICYGKSGVAKDRWGKDITDFLSGRGYPYQTRRVTDNPDHARACAEMWCKLKERREGGVACIEEALKRIEDHVAFTVVGDKFFVHTGPAVHKEIDQHFKGSGS